MLLSDLIKDIVEANSIPEGIPVDVQDIYSDSRQVRPGSLFVALPGTQKHGKQYIAEAVQRGARAVMTGAGDGVPESSVPVIQVADLSSCLKKMLVRFYGKDIERLNMIGVTGTNGKTTVTFLLESVFRQAGKRCGVVGTINYRFAEKVWPAKNTTPGLVENFHFLSDIARQGADACVMEVSSHGLDQGRVEMLDFSNAVLTNVTQDHLDYHKDMETYFQAKAKLFVQLSPEKCAVVNGDDSYGQRLLSMIKCRSRTYGLKNAADVNARDIALTLEGIRCTVQSPEGTFALRSVLIGQHNVYNILAACSVCLEQKVPVSDIQAGIEGCPVVPGRMESIRCGQDFYVFIDYAHTEDALSHVLRSVRSVASSNIILVFGCGGDRDQGKRPKMGQVASLWADKIIVTNDNPRTEDPGKIVAQIVNGFSHDRYEVIMDRTTAIEAAIHQAHKGDVVLIAGKGHETYQIFGTQTVPFDEAGIVRHCLQKRGCSKL